ncbi:MAG: hypothetical protein ABI374_08690 [Ginsengibacter sp.]
MNHLLKTESYTPIHKIKLPSFQNDYQIEPSTPWLVALEKLKPKIKLEKSSISDYHLFYGCHPNKKITKFLFIQELSGGCHIQRTQ